MKILKDHDPDFKDSNNKFSLKLNKIEFLRKL
jgi:hypothetical protein